MATQPKITPFLWYEKDAKQAAKFYVSVFAKGSKIISASTMTDTPSGTVEIVRVQLLGQEFNLMAAGPFEKFTAATSFVVACKTQAEIDRYWTKLSAHPEAEMCGWLKDKYGVTWQIVPEMLQKMLADKDRKKAARVQQAFLKMKKFDIAKLKAAYRGK
ncbi:MAG TPA: VOC family protein [Candidatus Krumholzibacteria bacterium]|nr:VOC family protein [Candidatus Krumholzibacteria bacterium]